VTGLIVDAEYNAQTSSSGIPAMVMAHVQPLGMTDAICANPFPLNAVKTACIDSWLY